jgi:hypothetical protein
VLKGFDVPLPDSSRAVSTRPGIEIGLDRSKLGDKPTIVIWPILAGTLSTGFRLSCTRT